MDCRVLNSTAANNRKIVTKYGDILSISWFFFAFCLIKWPRIISLILLTQMVVKALSFQRGFRRYYLNIIVRKVCCIIKFFLTILVLKLHLFILLQKKHSLFFVCWFNRLSDGRILCNCHIDMISALRLSKWRLCIRFLFQGVI